MEWIKTTIMSLIVVAIAIAIGATVIGSISTMTTKYNGTNTDIYILPADVQSNLNSTSTNVASWATSWVPILLVVIGAVAVLGYLGAFEGVTGGRGKGSFARSGRRN